MVTKTGWQHSSKYRLVCSTEDNMKMNK